MSDTDSVIYLFESYLKESFANRNAFKSLSSPTTDFSSMNFEFSTVFSNAIILQCLNESNTEISKSISKKIVKFLLTQKTNLSSFNYWDNKSKEYASIPYPDDLDDTSCALQAIIKFDRELLSGADLKKILSLLINQEVNEGGPYYTWVVNDDEIEWKDIDLAVNSNISNLLAEFGIELPNIVQYVEEAIVNKSIGSRYYPTSVPVAYFISKWYQGKEKGELIKILIKMYDRRTSTLLDRILIATSLVRLGLIDHRIINETLNTIISEPTSVFKPFPFYRGVNPNNDGIRYFAGSKYVTTAMAIELLSLINKKLLEIQKSKTTKYLTDLNEKIFHEVAVELSNAGGMIASCGIERLEILRQNPDMSHITCVPHIAYNSLKRRNHISSRILDDLSKATLYGWLAYDIYDDFYDKNSEAQMLASANFALRELSSAFTANYLPKKFHKFFRETMALVDNANAQESLAPHIKLSRNSITISENVIKIYKKFRHPENKSIGHILSIVAVYILSGRSLNSADVKDLISFFKHYLAARQIIDDMHDWEEDLQRGRLNTVSSLLIADCNKRKITKISLSELRKLFWYKIVIKSCYHAQKHINNATDTNAPFLELLNPLREVINNTLREQKKAVSFLLI